jgi:hypothetical protein
MLKEHRFKEIEDSGECPQTVLILDELLAKGLAHSCTSDHKMLLVTSLNQMGLELI